MNHNWTVLALLGPWLWGCSTPPVVPPPDRPDAAQDEPSTAPAAPAQAPAPLAPAPARVPVAYSFDADTAGDAPRGFAFGRTGEGRPGRWLVRPGANAPSAPNVLAQI